MGGFVANIFKMFDVNNDRVLTFEEFTFATSAQNYDDPQEKLFWLFDNVYDKVFKDSFPHLNYVQFINILKLPFNLFLQSICSNLGLYWKNKST